jgi:prepilin-type N-terminal cleavage/methylation domain-containing protein
MLATETTGRPAFSMMELVIVMVIIGILAAIAIPRMGGGAENAKVQALQASLQEVRNRIEVYKAEHEGKIPDLQFVAQMTQYTDVLGNVSDKPAPKFLFGPYLNAIPKNPYSGLDTVRFLTSAGESGGARSVDRGWTYNVVTGEFAADCSDARLTTVEAIPLNKL